MQIYGLPVGVSIENGAIVIHYRLHYGVTLFIDHRDDLSVPDDCLWYQPIRTVTSK